MDKEYSNLIIQELINVSKKDTLINILTKISLTNNNYTEDVKFQIYYNFFNYLSTCYNSELFDSIIKSILPILYNDTNILKTNLYFENIHKGDIANRYGIFFSDMNKRFNNKSIPNITPIFLNGFNSTYTVSLPYIPNKYLNLFSTPMYINKSDILNLSKISNLKEQINNKIIMIHSLVYSDYHNDITIFLKNLYDLDIIPSFICICPFLSLTTNIDNINSIYNDSKINISFIHFSDYYLFLEYFKNFGIYNINNSQIDYIISKLNFYGLGIPNSSGHYSALSFLAIEIKDIADALIQFINNQYVKDHIFNNFHNIDKYKIINK